LGLKNVFLTIKYTNMMRTIFLPHAVAAIIVTALTGLIYVSVQQVYRIGANDPQIQMARDMAYAADRGKPTAEIANIDTVDLEQSLGTFMQLYDAKNNLIQSSGYIGGKAPAVPAGVLEGAARSGESAVTWQPTPNVRLASVIVRKNDGGYVLVGKSLWEVEKRESNLLTMAFLCWLVCVGVIGAHGLLQSWLVKREK